MIVELTDEAEGDLERIADYIAWIIVIHGMNMASVVATQELVQRLGLV